MDGRRVAETSDVVGVSEEVDGRGCADWVAEVARREREAGGGSEESGKEYREESGCF